MVQPDLKLLLTRDIQQPYWLSLNGLTPPILAVNLSFRYIVPESSIPVRWPTTYWRLRRMRCHAVPCGAAWHRIYVSLAYTL